MEAVTGQQKPLTVAHECSISNGLCTVNSAFRVEMGGQNAYSINSDLRCTFAYGEGEMPLSFSTGRGGVEFEFDFERALAAMVYIASKQPPALDTYKMCKLMVLSDKLHLVRFGRPITGDDMRAMDYGPVPSAIYDVLKVLVNPPSEINERVRALAEYLSVDKQYQYPRFHLKQSVDFDYFLSRTEMAAIDEVVAKHGNKTFDELYNLTHAMPAYLSVWDDEERNSNNPLMSFEQLFTNDSDAIAGAKEEMIENFKIRQAVCGEF